MSRFSSIRRNLARSPQLDDLGRRGFDNEPVYSWKEVREMLDWRDQYIATLKRDITTLLAYIDREEDARRRYIRKTIPRRAGGLA